MEIDPHTIQAILSQVRDQLRCPQCRKKMEVNLPSLKVLGGGFAVMQMQCTACDAHVMLHASVKSKNSEDGIYADGRNASSKITVSVDEITSLKESIKEANGSFTKMFNATK